LSKHGVNRSTKNEKNRLRNIILSSNNGKCRLPGHLQKYRSGNEVPVTIFTYILADLFKKQQQQTYIKMSATSVFVMMVILN